MTVSDPAAPGVDRFGDRAAVSIDAVFDAIDAANAADPNQVAGRPRALHEGRRATQWLARLAPDASAALQIAVRAHHLKRWELARTSYPAGRAGYLRWRRDNKARQAAHAREILATFDADAHLGDRVEALLLRRGLGSDLDTQHLEDAACLVFLETWFSDLTDVLDHDHLVDVVRKTLRKMSPRAIVFAGEVPISSAGQAVLDEAVRQSVSTDDPTTPKGNR